MIKKSKKLRSIYAGLVVTTFLCTSFQSVAATTTKLGNEEDNYSSENSLSDEQVNWINENMEETEKVLPNKIGLERINSTRKEKGLEKIDENKAVQIGQEVVSKVNENQETKSEISSINYLGLNTSTSSYEISASDIPNSVDNSELQYFPPVIGQGGQGSCSGFSSAYYQATYMTALARGWDVKNDVDYSKRFSPKWSYNFINRGKNEGATIANAYQLIKEQGLATWKDFPYSEDTDSQSYTEWPKDPKVWENAANYMMDKMGYVNIWDGSFTPVKNEKDPNLNNVKELLANGYVLLITYFNSSCQNKVIMDDLNTPVVDKHTGETAGYVVDGLNGPHGAALVGYDDDIWVDINGDGDLDIGEKGAFKTDSGYWICYDALNKISAVEGLQSSGSRDYGWMELNRAYWMTADTTYIPKLLGEVIINHSERNQLQYEIGYSETNENSPTITWAPQILNMENGACSFDGTHEANDGTVVIDYSNVIGDNVLSSPSKKWYMKITDKSGDGKPAIIKQFRVVDPSTGSRTYYKGSIVSIDDNSVTLSIDYTLGSANNQVAEPKFSIAGGTYKYAKKVTINCDTPGATIRYTTTGETPTIDSPIYDGPISIYGNMTLKAIAIKPDMEYSEIVSADYNAGHLIGDVTGDGKINAIDLVSILGYINGQTATFPVEDGLFVADVNADGIVDIKDVDLMKQVSIVFRAKEHTTHMVGDLNDDEKVNDIDIAYFSDYLSGKIDKLPVEDILWATDVSGDGKTNAIDLALITQYNSGSIKVFPKERHIYSLGDVNGDGNINAIDLAQMGQYINGLITDFSVSDDLWIGDLNADYVIDGLDAGILRQYITGEIKFFQRERPIHKIGDVDGNGKIDNLDLSKILSFDKGLISSFSVNDILWTGDVNGDNIINNIDFQYVKQYNAGSITSFPKEQLVVAEG